MIAIEYYFSQRQRSKPEQVPPCWMPSKYTSLLQRVYDNLRPAKPVTKKGTRWQWWRD